MAENPWIYTYTGKKFHFLNPHPDEIDIVDIAHALSNICRWGGHLRVPYFVTEHCIHVSDNCEPEYAFEGLMHDNGETYVHDICTPLKKFLGKKYSNVEDRIVAVVYEKYGIYPTSASTKHVKLIDKKLALTEARDFGIPLPFTTKVKPLSKKLGRPMTSIAARAEFLYRFEKLYANRK